MMGLRIVVPVAVVVLLVAASALADPIEVQIRDSASSDGYYIPGTGSRKLKATADGGDFGSIWTGTFELEADYGDGWLPTYTYCTEPTQHIQFGTQPDDTTGLTYHVTPLDEYTPVTASEADFLGILWANAFDDSTTNRKKAAAFQAIVWETTVDNDLNFTGGDFKLKEADAFTADVMDIADAWIANIFDQTWTESVLLTALTHPRSQDFLTTEIPEPSSVALTAAGVLMLLTRRRKRREQATA